MTTTRTLRATRDDLSVTYGPGSYSRKGILSEHVHIAEQGGAYVRAAASTSGVEWVVWPDGAVDPILCPELVPDRDCDNYPITSRCGAFATHDGMCEGHAAEMNDWRAMSEAERAAWERRNEEDSYFG